MKRIIAILAIAVLLMSVAMTALADVIAKPGDEIELTFSVASSGGAQAAVVNIDFSKWLEFVSTKNIDPEDGGPQESGDFGFFTKEGKGGQIAFVKNEKGKPAGGIAEGTSVKAKFKVKDGVADGEYTIVGNTIVELSAATESKTSGFKIGDVKFTISAAGGARVAGDVNGDGKVNGKDSMTLIQYLAKWPVTINVENADVTGDDKVNGKDSMTLIQYLAKWPVTLK